MQRNERTPEYPQLNDNPQGIAQRRLRQIDSELTSQIEADLLSAQTAHNKAAQAKANHKVIGPILGQFQDWRASSYDDRISPLKKARNTVRGIAYKNLNGDSISAQKYFLNRVDNFIEAQAQHTEFPHNPQQLEVDGLFADMRALRELGCEVAPLVRNLIKTGLVDRNFILLPFDPQELTLSRVLGEERNAMCHSEIYALSQFSQEMLEREGQFGESGVGGMDEYQDIEIPGQPPSVMNQFRLQALSEYASGSIEALPTFFAQKIFNRIQDPDIVGNIFQDPEVVANICAFSAVASEAQRADMLNLFPQTIESAE